MSDKTTLLNCPFCGSEYTQVRWMGFKDKNNGAFEPGFRGECTECFALTRAFGTEAEAIAAWNTRAELEDKTCGMQLIWTDYEDGECYRCSACKGNTYTHGWIPHHCSECGAKVKAVMS